MNTTSRIISIILIAVFALCACQTSEPEIIPEFAPDSEQIVNLNGNTISWGFAKSGSKDENVLGFIPGTSFADMATERKKEIENNYNCKINMVYSDFGTIGSELQSAVMSGQPIYDIATNESYVFVDSIRAGYCTGLSSILDVSDTNKWGTPNMLQSLFWKNDLFGVLPYAWPDLLYTSFGYPIVVNETLISQYGHEDPREYVENNTWNWDMFESVLHQYTVNEGERTIYGMASHDAYFAMMMFLSNGVTLSEYVDDSVVCGAYTDAGFEAMSRARQIYQETCKEWFYPDDTTGGVVVAFKNGDCVLLTTHAGAIIGTSDTIMYEMDNVGILPYPLGPNGQEGVYKGYHESILFATVIPINARDIDVASLVLSAMYEPFKGYETKEDIINYYSNQTFFDKRDAAVFVNMLENTEYGFFKEGARSLIQETVETNTALSQLRDSHQSRYDKIVEDYIANCYYGRVSVFGE